jgi:hypothetical protein
VDVHRSQIFASRVNQTLALVPAVGVGLAVGLVVVLTAQRATAQSTIFNIPSTDTVDKGKSYVEFDYLPQAPGPTIGAITTLFNPRYVAGLPNDVEVGVNFPIFHNSDAAPSNLAYIQPNVKWKFYKNDDMGLAASAGVVVNAPLNSRDGQATWSYFYGNVSMKFKDAMGARLTLGAYGVAANADPKSGPVSFVGKRGGAIVGYEQPLGGPVSFVADWFSTQNSLGYFTPGISIALPHSGLFNAGYSIGNDSWENSNATKNRFVFLYYGVTF